MLIKFFMAGRQTDESAMFEAELKSCLISREDFLTRMRHERLRSERYETPLSLVVMDIKALMHDLVGPGKMRTRVFSRHIVEALRNSTREYDIKGWYHEGRAGILTPNTDESGARALARNLIMDLARRFGPESHGKEHKVSRSITLASLPAYGSSLPANDHKTKAKPSPVRARDYRSSSHAPDSRTLSLRSIKGGAVDVALVTWPISIELLTYEQARRLQLKLKRAMDVLGSLFGIALFGPLMLFIALLIKITSPGPILFRQRRLGFLGNPFTFLKFRSMKVNSDESVHRQYVTKLIKGDNGAINNGTPAQPVYKINGDPRVTWLGRFLRKTSLDELPQFFNVLTGDMSLVGPRPPIPYEYDSYQRWHCRRVLEVKPGITGLWQVSGRSRTTFNDMVRLDLTYVRTWNLWLDVKILLKTFWTVVSTKGGY
jgi:lipopolysaccharide/colanic/teichoic acid biosynthesis glycosyltransferase/GGDEF domain-containing protein